MNQKLLINEVRKRSPLWKDKTSESHQEQTIVGNLWGEVAKALGTSRDQVREEWESLKAHFEKDLMKCKKKKKKSTWPLFNSMRFLRNEQVCKKLAFGSEKSCKPTQSSMETDEKDPQLETTTSTDANSTGHGGLIDGDKVICELATSDDGIALHSPYVPGGCGSTSETDDFHFLMSLMSYMNMYSPLDKLRLRNRIQQLFIEFAGEQQLAAGDESISPAAPTSSS